MNANSKEYDKIRRKTTPRKRGHYAFVAHLVFIVLCLIGYLLLNVEPLDVSLQRCCAFYIIFLLFISFCQYGLRFFQFIEEINHLHSRYHGSKMTLFYDVFYVHYMIILMTCCLFFAVYVWSFYQIFCEHYNLHNLCLFVPSYFTMELVNLRKCPLEVSLNIDTLKGLDYGSGMAHSFFTGYLLIVLPKGESAGIKELMRNYESVHHVKFEYYKLFILIPSSLSCPSSLVDFSEIMEESDSLETKELDRAGVKRRPYRNSVYKIKTPRRKIYISAEYATPLRTMQEVISSNLSAGHIYKKYKSDILLNFYLTLKKLIESHEGCRDVCELMFYNDDQSKVDVGHLLMYKLDTMHKKTQ